MFVSVATALDHVTVQTQVMPEDDVNCPILLGSRGLVSGMTASQARQLARGLLAVAEEVEEREREGKTRLSAYFESNLMRKLDEIARRG